MLVLLLYIIYIVYIDLVATENRPDDFRVRSVEHFVCAFRRGCWRGGATGVEVADIQVPDTVLRSRKTCPPFVYIVIIITPRGDISASSYTVNNNIILAATIMVI
jgi:hypothetical protein